MKLGDLRAYIDPWGLSDAQTHASYEGLRYLHRMQASPISPGPRQFLIWAVTGRGKTEMIFPFIHYTAARGGRVLLATPRKDVVLELQPRIQQAFAGVQRGHAVRRERAALGAGADYDRNDAPAVAIS